MSTETHIEDALPHDDGEKSARIDLGLALLSASVPSRAALSPVDIAAWCDCSPAMISHIEARALRRMREKVRNQFQLTSMEMADCRRFLALHFHS